MMATIPAQDADLARRCQRLVIRREALVILPTGQNGGPRKQEGPCRWKGRDPSLGAIQKEAGAVSPMG